MQVPPSWCANKMVAWERMVDKWVSEQWANNHNALRDRRLLMPGASHHQGNLNIDEYASRWVRGLVYLHLLSQTLILSFLLLTYLIVFSCSRLHIKTSHVDGSRHGFCPTRTRRRQTLTGTRTTTQLSRTPTPVSLRSSVSTPRRQGRSMERRSIPTPRTLTVTSS
jgi:hypothetical protein